ncbi:uncharacterized protein PG986_008526 [Apiospora aurea]|uniref:Uncharacterized protein n=1 Tax=Apiospora aurea TaxID=335848 RepID=A0ABR1QFM6_9PEZI
MLPPMCSKYGSPDHWTYSTKLLAGPAALGSASSKPISDTNFTCPLTGGLLGGHQRHHPLKELLPATLNNVHARVNLLERLVDQRQPPTVAPDWDSLRYRTMRLWRTPVRGLPSTYALVVSADKWWPSAEETDDQAIALALERTLRSLGIFSYSATPPDAVENGTSSDKDGSSSSSSSDDQFDIAAQEFCNLAGKNRKKPLKPYASVRELYAAAFELNLVLEGKPYLTVPYPPVPPVFGPGRLPMPGIPMGEGGRPGGSIPPPSYSPRGPPVIIRPRKHKKRSRKTQSKGGFLRFMLCGRGDDDSDDDSDDESVRAKKGWRRWLPRWLSSKKGPRGYETDSSSGSSSLAD